VIRFDGLYASPPQTLEGDSLVFFGYLRFYADGMVIDCTSSGTPEQVIRWFDRDNPSQPFMLRGHYSLSDDEISFSPEFSYQDEGEEVLMKIDYKGHVRDDGATLDLTIASLINGHARKDIYRFAQEK
jgi:hypothetical protein